MSGGTVAGGVRGARAGLAGLAAGGVMAGHWIAYAVREPDAGARAVLLESTGHHFLPQLSVLAAVAAVVALLAVPLRSSARAGPRRYGATLRWMAPAQAVAFLALETGERLLAHGRPPAAAELLDPAVGVGLAAQVIIAAAATGLVVALARLSPRRISRPEPLVAPPAPGTSASPVHPPAGRPGRDAHTLRGPPVLSR